MCLGMSSFLSHSYRNTGSRIMVSACDECRPISKSPGRNLIGFAWQSWARADHLDWDETTDCTVRISRLFSLSLSLYDADTELMGPYVL